MKTYYYLISYAHDRGFGEYWAFSVGEPIDLEIARKDIIAKNNVSGVVFIAINKVTKSQLEKAGLV